MALIAFRNLLQERARLVISSAGVAFAIVLMLILLGIYRGAITQFTLVVERNPVDLFVAKEGITDFFHGLSLVDAGQVAQMRGDPGVRSVVPAVVQRVVLERQGTKFDTAVFSTIPGSKAGAPWEVSAGATQPNDGEIVVSRVLADELGKGVGETVNVQGTELRVVGLAEQASSLGNHYAWVTLNQARAMLAAPKLVNFAYISVDNPSEAGAVARRLSLRYPNLSVLEKHQFVANNRQELEQSFLPIIQAMVVIALLIGISVIGLTIYTATMDKSREYGILKAIGVSNGQLYRIVLVQTMISTLVGLIAGGLLATGVARILEAWINLRPQITLDALAMVAVIAVLMALAASLFPVRQLVQIDPARVFRSA